MNPQLQQDEGHDELAYYAVAFLDVMGQKTRIRELRGVPTNVAGVRAAAEILRDTVGYLRRVRSLFDGTFKTINTTTPIFDSIPDEKKALAHAMRASEVSYRGLSDSLIATVPLRNENDHCTPMNGVFATMWASCCVAVVALTDGKSIRGGIDVGWGVPLGDGEFYGAALERAYTLESVCADYPRIVVGEELRNYLGFVEGNQSTTPFAGLARDLARECGKLIVEDEDGKQVLDLVGPSIRSLGPLGEEVIRLAVTNTQNHEMHFRRLGNVKLADRYRRLTNLLKSGLAR